MGDPLEWLAAEIPWELFPPLLEKVREKDRKSATGGKPFDVVLMFEVMLLLTLYNLADEAVVDEIRDRLSFARLIGLEVYDSVHDGTTARRHDGTTARRHDGTTARRHDGTTVWRFRERLEELERIKLIVGFHDEL